MDEIQMEDQNEIENENESEEVSEISEDEVESQESDEEAWDEEEISFQQWESMRISDISHMKGYCKIKQFGEKAAGNGLGWVWVDTYAHLTAQASA